MHSSLSILRQTPPVHPSRFLAAHPGCHIQYFDDTPARDSAKALSTPSFDVAVARRKQQERCAVTFSLQAFGESRTKAELLCFRNLGVEIDVVPAAARRAFSTAAIDRRKEEYLVSRLLPFPLRPHWLIETAGGFHVIFRIQPQRMPKTVRTAAKVNRRLVRALGGDENAALLTQVLRVPGTLQFKDPAHPFLCRLLLDTSASNAPYGLAAVENGLNAWDVFHCSGTAAGDGKEASAEMPTTAWRAALPGVPERQRNASAAGITGAILCRLPEDLWEAAGWSGLKEWNYRNAAPLPERELRSVFESITRRERAVRHARQSPAGQRRGFLIQLNIRISRSTPPAAESKADGARGPAPTPRNGD
jgi:hypothetical protein